MWDCLLIIFMKKIKKKEPDKMKYANDTHCDEVRGC